MVTFWLIFCNFWYCTQILQFTQCGGVFLSCLVARMTISDQIQQQSRTRGWVNKRSKHVSSKCFWFYCVVKLLLVSAPIILTILFLVFCSEFALSSQIMLTKRRRDYLIECPLKELFARRCDCHNNVTNGH